MKRQLHKSRSTNRLHTPVVSVIIPVFNGAKFLREAVSSVMKSTYKNFEILLIDDGSSDKSKQICHELERKYKGSIRFFPMHKNNGLGRVLNFALKKAKGKFIARLNQDDITLPHRIKTEIEYLKKHKDVVAVGSWNRLFDEKGNTQILQYLPTDADIKNVWLLVSPFSDPTTMYRKNVAIRVGGYIQSYWPADDTQLWYRMGLVGKLANIQKPLVNVRWHKDAGSVKYFRRMAVVTYRMHRWAHNRVQRAPWYVQAWWIMQYLAGLLLPPQLNWRIYWKIKQMIAAYNAARHSLARAVTKHTAMAVNVINQPSTAKRSGVYKR